MGATYEYYYCMCAYCHRQKITFPPSDVVLLFPSPTAPTHLHIKKRTDDRVFSPPSHRSEGYCGGQSNRAYSTVHTYRHGLRVRIG